MNTRRGCESEQSTSCNISTTRSEEPQRHNFRSQESVETTKFGYVLANLEPKYIEEVEDVIEYPPEEG